MATHLRRLFESLVTEADLQALVHDGREEDLYLEFKQKHDRRTDTLDDADRRSFSKAVVGFANADGGVLVFGIESTRTADGVDRAAGLKPIQGHARFRARLLDSTLNTSQPVVDDIEIECIDSPSGGGYVKCLVPQSLRAPHRAIVAEHQYWRRTATGHRRMDHYELEDLFGRRLRPALAFFVELRPRGADDPLEEVHFFLLNEGRGLAKHVGFLWKPMHASIHTVYGFGLFDASKLNGEPAVTYYDAHHVVHANEIYFAAGHAIVQRQNRASPLGFEVRWYAEDMESKQSSGKVALGQRSRVA